MMLLKFGENDRIETLQSGKIFMQPLEYYRKLEEEQKKKGQGDKYEGKLHIEQKMIAKLSNFSIKATGFTLSYDSDEKYLASCYYNADYQRFKLIGEDEKDKIYAFEFTELEKKEFCKWGDTVLLIDKCSFLEKIKDKLEEQFISAEWHKIKYYNSKLPDSEYIEDYKNIKIDRLFWKDDYFINQNEFRLITAIQSDEGKIAIDIKDISDISKKYKIKEFLENGFYKRISKDNL